MELLQNANWIKQKEKTGDVCPIFKRTFSVNRPVKNATLWISTLGVYEARINQGRVGDFILAPGWTSYHNRLQYQEYDVTSHLQIGGNVITVAVGKGWCAGEVGFQGEGGRWSEETALIAAMTIEYVNGESEVILTDQTWEYTLQSPIVFSEIFDGEIYDARIVPTDWIRAAVHAYPKHMLISQEGEIVREMEEIKPINFLITPTGEWVLDFGQNLTGYVKFYVEGKPGDRVHLSHGEVLDREGNFYTENLRSAKQEITYICNGDEGGETYSPHFTYQGFRYVRINEHPLKEQSGRGWGAARDTGQDVAEISTPNTEQRQSLVPNIDKWKAEFCKQFRALVVYSEIKRTGFFQCSSPMLNQLFHNVIWGQKGNFLDVPTDCPQRNERLGWTGDAQVFVKTASYNFDVNRFFTKWLRDLSADQLEDGRVPYVIPQVMPDFKSASAAWGDAAVICPWQMFLTYGNREILLEQYPSMKKWVNYIRGQGGSEFLWDCGTHFGDWLAMDAREGSNRGATSEYLIATAFFAYSTSLLIKTAKVLGKDTSEPEVYADYMELYAGIVGAFQDTYMPDGRLTSDTQTAHVLALHFHLVKDIDKKQTIDRLVELVRENGNKLTTGFVGTPYLLHVLADNGHVDLAYDLLLEEGFPSWLFSVRMGATTIWEHWDSIREDGSMWSPSMNSFNHYAYGSVADFMYGVLAGINTDETRPGFQHILFKPVPDRRLDFVEASIQTGYGMLSSRWEKVGGANVTALKEAGGYRYTFCIPKGCTATVMIGARTWEVGAGTHVF